MNGEENVIVALLDEFNAHQTKESIFCYHIDKIECDFQAKLYDLKGNFKLEKALEDIQYYGEKGNEIKEKVRTASDVWIEYDKQLYEDDQMFQTLIVDIQRLRQDDN